jgi:hypothetical protein
MPITGRGSLWSLGCTRIIRRGRSVGSLEEHNATFHERPSKQTSSPMPWIGQGAPLRALKRRSAAHRRRPTALPPSGLQCRTRSFRGLITSTAQALIGRGASLMRSELHGGSDTAHARSLQDQRGRRRVLHGHPNGLVERQLGVIGAAFAGLRRCQSRDRGWRARSDVDPARWPCVGLSGPRLTRRRVIYFHDQPSGYRRVRHSVRGTTRSSGVPDRPGYGRSPQPGGRREQWPGDVPILADTLGHDACGARHFIGRALHRRVRSVARGSRRGCDRYGLKVKHLFSARDHGTAVPTSWEGRRSRDVSRHHQHRNLRLVQDL